MSMLFSNMTDEGKSDSLKSVVLEAMSGQFKSTYGTAQLAQYIGRIVDDMELPVVEACYESVGSVARAVMGAVRGLADDFCEERFGTLLSRGDVRISPVYRFPESFVQASPMTSYDKGLYEAEDGRVDGLERKMIGPAREQPACEVVAPRGGAQGRRVQHQRIHKPLPGFPRAYIRRNVHGHRDQGRAPGRRRQTQTASGYKVGPTWPALGSGTSWCSTTRRRTRPTRSRWRSLGRRYWGEEWRRTKPSTSRKRKGGRRPKTVS